MDRQQTATINFDVQIRLDDRGDHWVAYIEPPGTTEYGATAADALARVDDALDFFVTTLVGEIGLENFRRYLDRHGVKNSVIVPNGHSVKTRQTFPVSRPVEVAAVA